MFLSYFNFSFNSLFDLLDWDKFSLISLSRELSFIVKILFDILVLYVSNKFELCKMYLILILIVSAIEILFSIRFYSDSNKSISSNIAWYKFYNVTNSEVK